ncbi:MAG: acetyl-CoA carboxylase biotin carboxyl carrier protein [Paracrocinitomix sp.]|jgi:acetyl-CoA carboxylase biotin carboxyl carrier protein|tara:strand:+ start:230 stop:445 length:216 start_codon:yes stop_codon:yes gene_type:complete
MSTPVKSPVVGTVWKIQVAVGDAVAEGDEIMILESMKMEIPVEADASGTVISFAVAEGDQVAEGALLATIE